MFPAGQSVYFSLLMLLKAQEFKRIKISIETVIYGSCLNINLLSIMTKNKDEYYYVSKIQHFYHYHALFINV
jgi:hypothetical protein